MLSKLYRLRRHRLRARPTIVGRDLGDPFPTHLTLPSTRTQEIYSVSAGGTLCLIVNGKEAR